MPTKITSKKKSLKPALPVELARRATAASTAKRARLVRQARAHLALIVRRRAEIVEAFYDIGEALAARAT